MGHNPPLSGHGRIRLIHYPSACWSMGKTRATYRDRLQGFENDWKAFHRGLIREYQPHWDETLV